MEDNLETMVGHRPDHRPAMLDPLWDMLLLRARVATEGANSLPMLNGLSLALDRTSTMDLAVIRPRGQRPNQSKTSQKAGRKLDIVISGRRCLSLDHAPGRISLCPLFMIPLSSFSRFCGFLSCACFCCFHYSFLSIFKHYYSSGL
jgi:hypothetical protein